MDFQVTIKLPDCGHEIKVKCKTAFEKRVFCTKKCAKTLTCGHKCMDLCRNECSSNNCKQLVMKDNKKLACGHSKFLTYCCDKDKGNQLFIFRENTNIITKVYKKKKITLKIVKKKCYYTRIKIFNKIFV